MEDGEPVSDSKQALGVASSSGHADRPRPPVTSTGFTDDDLLPVVYPPADWATLAPTDALVALESELEAGSADSSVNESTDRSSSRNVGESNFRDWQATRRQLDGPDARMETTRPGDGGRGAIDLLTATWADLPPEIRLRFEQRSFPDLMDVLEPPATPADTSGSEAESEPQGAAKIGREQAQSGGAAEGTLGPGPSADQVLREIAAHDAGSPGESAVMRPEDLGQQNSVTAVASHYGSPMEAGNLSTVETEVAPQGQLSAQGSGATDVPVADGVSHASKRGEESLAAWQATRRHLDGDDARLDVEVAGPNGSVMVDLMRATWADLPEKVRRQFEQHSFPDLSDLLTRAEAPTHPPAEALSADSVDVRRPAEATSARSSPGSSPADTTDSAPRPMPIERHSASQPRFGLGLGGMASGVGRAGHDTRRAASGTGRATAAALQTMRASISNLRQQRREAIQVHIRRWRESRALSALDSVERSMSNVERAMGAIREHSEFREAFQQWPRLASSEAREKARSQFRDSLLRARFSAEGQALLLELFGLTESFRHHATRAVLLAHQAGGDTRALKERLIWWGERMSDQSGPVVNHAREILSDKFKRAVESISRVLEGLASRIALLKTPRPA